MFKNAIENRGHPACFRTTWIAIDSNYTTRKVFLRNPSNQEQFNKIDIYLALYTILVEQELRI